MPGIWMLVVAATSAQAGSHTHSVTPMPEVTVNGTVEVIRDDGLEGCELCEACAACSAVHVLLRTKAGRTEVHLAPAWFLDLIEFAPSVGTVISVTGIRVRFLKGRGVGAREIQVDRTVFKLRDEHGLPLWRRVLTDARESACGRTGR